MADFVRLIVYQEASKLSASVYRMMKLLRGPSRAKAADQMIRASESVPANLVEGVGRGVSRDCVRFLTIARASAQELEAHLRQARLSGRLLEVQVDPLIDHTRRVRFLLRRFQESVERRLKPPEPPEPQ